IKIGQGGAYWTSTLTLGWRPWWTSSLWTSNQARGRRTTWMSNKDRSNKDRPKRGGSRSRIPGQSFLYGATMALYRLAERQPQIDPSAFIAPGAHVVGTAVLHAQTSVWFSA